MSWGKSKMTTWLTWAMSTPRPRTSVATSARSRPSRKALRVTSRWSCFLAPCMTPQRSRPKCLATTAPRSSAASRVPTKIRALPGVGPSSPPSALSRCFNRSGIFCSMAEPWLQWVLTTSTTCRISRGGSVMPEWPGSSRRAPASAPGASSAPGSPASGSAETLLKLWPRAQSRRAAASTSGGQVAEKKSIWRSARTSAAMAATSGPKPSSSMRSPSSSTRKDTRRRPKAPMRRKSRSRPGVATTRCVCCWKRSVCSWSERRGPP
mmetsp:Transcript_35276/g.112211  ORF Transcript_35276/g.112211 Transcript_35276/m.112211 type:complete len:265 (+) Transcript_35276:1144-1938(+)